MVHKALQGFDAFVEAEVLPLFERMLATRKAAKATRNKGLKIGVAVGLGLGAALLFFTQNWGIALVGLALGPLLGVAPGVLAMANAKGDFLDATISMVAGFLGLRYQAKGFTPPHFELLTRAKLVPDHDRAKFVELVQGERHGMPFSLYEASLESRIETGSGKTKTVTWVPVFFGQFLHIPYARKFSSHTLIARDAGLFNAVSGPGKGMKRVRLVDPKFEKIFEVYSTDQMEGRYLVDPLFMERLLQLEGKDKGRELQAAFFEQAVMVSLTGGESFYPRLTLSADGAKAAALEIATVFTNIFDLIDGLFGRHQKNG